ncbi:MAG: hypothetical protein K5639_03855 [Eubacterium sp.]|nr:hypothetical protein [Eubacterium sp.]
MKNRLFKRLWSIFMLLVIALSMPVGFIAGTANAAITEETKVGNSSVITGKFLYPSYNKNKDIYDQFFYSDGYFDGDPGKYDEHLASMSLCLALSAGNLHRGGDKDYTEKSLGVRQLLTDTGYTDISVNKDYMSRPTSDSIAFAIAHKKVGDKVIVPIAIRGLGYEAEWENNFLVGSSGDAEGFKSSANKVLSTAGNYVQTYLRDEKNIVFWVTGYSRSAAVAELVAKDVSGLAMTESKVFAYCFEAPRICGTEKLFGKYNNIHCVESSSDPIPWFVPSYLGFGHYGVVETIKDSYKIDQKYLNLSATVENALLKKNPILAYKKVEGASDETKDFLGYFETLFKKVFPDRASYAEKKIEETTAQNAIANVVGIVTSLSKEQIKTLETKLKKSLKENKEVVSIAFNLLMCLKDGINKHFSKQKEIDDFYDSLWSLVDKPLKDTLTATSYETLKANKKTIVHLALDILHADYSTDKDDNMCLRALGTIMLNIKTLVAPHVGDSLFELIKKSDSFYEGASKITDSRLDTGVTVGNPDRVAGEVKNKNGEIVAKFKGKSMTYCSDPEVSYGQSQIYLFTLEMDEKNTIMYHATNDDVRVIFAPDGYEIKLIIPDENKSDFVEWQSKSGKSLGSSTEFTEKAGSRNSVIQPVFNDGKKASFLGTVFGGNNYGGMIIVGIVTLVIGFILGSLMTRRNK